jgi:hypothetical protein
MYESNHRLVAVCYEDSTAVREYRFASRRSNSTPDVNVYKAQVKIISFLKTADRTKLRHDVNLKVHK